MYIHRWLHGQSIHPVILQNPEKHSALPSAGRQPHTMVGFCPEKSVNLIPFVKLAGNSCSQNLPLTSLITLKGLCWVSMLFRGEASAHNFHGDEKCCVILRQKKDRVSSRRKPGKKAVTRMAQGHICQNLGPLGCVAKAGHAWVNIVGVSGITKSNSTSQIPRSVLPTRSAGVAFGVDSGYGSDLYM